MTAVHDQVTKAFTEWRDDVYRYLLTLGLSPADAQEGAQEVFLRLYVALRKDEETIVNQRAWVFRVAHNYGLTLRSRGGILQQFHPDFEAALRDGDPGPERLAMDRQTLMRMHEALEQLSPRQRECLQLRAEGLRYQEIAGALGVGVSTVSQFLTRAISRLRQAVYE